MTELRQDVGTEDVAFTELIKAFEDDISKLSPADVARNEEIGETIAHFCFG